MRAHFPRILRAIYDLKSYETVLFRMHNRKGFPIRARLFFIPVFWLPWLLRLLSALTSVRLSWLEYVTLTP